MGFGAIYIKLTIVAHLKWPKFSPKLGPNLIPKFEPQDRGFTVNS